MTETTDTVPDHAGQIVWLTEWAARYGAVLKIAGTVGIGRDCVGISMSDHFIDTADVTWGGDQFAGEWWQPEDAYHKHDCLAVLGWGDGPLRQLYDWVRWLDGHGYGIEETYRKPTSDIDLLFHGVSLPKIVKLP